MTRYTILKVTTELQLLRRPVLRTLQAEGPEAAEPRSIPSFRPDLLEADLAVEDSQLPYAALHDPDADVLEADLTVEDLQPGEAIEARRDSNLLVAEAMPTRLISPTASRKVHSPSGIAWGVTAVGADRTALDGQGVRVCVLDTGIDEDHPAFEGVSLTQRNFTASADGDLQGHGTHCAGTFFGRDVANTRIGVAPGVSEALIGKVLDDRGAGSSEMLFDAINWAMDENAKVLSMSLGFDFPGQVERLVERRGYPIALATSETLRVYRDNLRVFDAIMALIEARSAFGGGMVVVAASGNESRRGAQENYRIGASVPSDAKGVVSVGALRQANGGLKIADFSNTYPVVSAPGVDIVSAQTGGGLVAYDGTSMACPHAAGVAALWWQRLMNDGFQQPSADTVVARLRNSCRTDVLGPSVDLQDRGDGLVQAPPSTGFQ